jgi:hypothetical protein
LISNYNRGKPRTYGTAGAGLLAAGPTAVTNLTK